MSTRPNGIPDSPPNQTDLELWFDANDLTDTHSSGNKISQWDDKSGNDYHATQSDSSFQPIYSEDLGPHRPSVDFSSVTNSNLEVNSGTDLDGKTDLEIFIVYKITQENTSARAIMKGDLNNTVEWQLYTDQDSIAFIPENGNERSVPIKDSLQVSRGRYDGSDYIVERYDFGTTTNTDSLSSTNDSIFIGSGRDTSETNNFRNEFKGHICEVLYYSNTNNINRNDIQKYLIGKWVDKTPVQISDTNLEIGNPDKIEQATDTTLLFGSFAYRFQCSIVHNSLSPGDSSTAEVQVGSNNVPGDREVVSSDFSRSSLASGSNDHSDNVSFYVTENQYFRLRDRDSTTTKEFNIQHIVIDYSPKHGNESHNPNFTDTSTFNNHSDRHEDDGVDEIDVTGLSGDLADEQNPKTHGNSSHNPNFTDTSTFNNHSDRHEDDGADEIDVTGLSGDLADEQDPKTHGNEDHSDSFLTPETSLFKLSSFPWRTDPDISPFIAERLSALQGLWPQTTDVIYTNNNKIKKVTHTVSNLNITGFPNTITTVIEVQNRDSDNNPTQIDYTLRKDDGNTTTIQKDITWNSNGDISNITTSEK